MITLAGLGLYSLMEDREEPASGGRIVLPDEQPWRPAEVGARRSPDGESESP